MSKNKRHDGGWRRTAQRYLYTSRWFALRRDDLILPNGDAIEYTVIEHPGYTIIVPVLDDGRVVMERVYRHTVQQTLLECPCGGLDGEPPDVAARRELEEETGYRAGKLESLGSYYCSTGLSDEECFIFLATELSADGQIQRENTEQIEIELIPLAELKTIALNGGVEDGTSVLSILLACAKLGV